MIENKWVLIEFVNEEKAQDFMCEYVEFDHVRKTVLDKNEAEQLLSLDKLERDIRELKAAVKYLKSSKTSEASKRTEQK